MGSWKLGDYAIARICKKVYAKVQISKNVDGTFHEEKVLGISQNEDGSINSTFEMCYYVEICRTKQCLWLPVGSLHMAERSRPFYGVANKVSPPNSSKVGGTVKKRKIYEDHTLPMNVKKASNFTNPDLNTTYDTRHIPKLEGKYENAFREFVRRGKEMIFDEFITQLNENLIERNKRFKYLTYSNVPTEDKFEMIIDNIVTEKEVENHLFQCWRYNKVYKESESMEDADSTAGNGSPEVQITLHASWCLVCGKRDRLRQCATCPSSYHVSCKKLWLVTILHRKNPPKSIQEQSVLIKKQLSSTRTIRSVRKIEDQSEQCPSCMWGPAVGYGDVVWHKLGSCPWWPAKVLTPGALPSCLVSRKHSVKQWPVRYYGTLNYSWCDASRMCLFLPSHTAVLDENRPEDLQDAVMDACDDYIRVYLT